jgi:hypothetical protein
VTTSSAASAASDGPPFGFPVLDEVPELAALLQLAVDAERLTARFVDAIVHIEADGLVGAATGVPLEQWLAIVARSTGADRRMLRTAARVCRRLPSLRAAFSAGEVSWSQVRTVACKVHDVPTHLDDRLDAGLARAIEGAAGADPDALARIVDWTLAALISDDAPERAAPDDDVFILQPRLDGSGGKVWGDFGPVGFAALDAATDPGPTGAASRTSFGDAADPGAVAANRRTAGRARAAKLIELCHRGPDGAPARPMLLLRAELDALLGDSGLPAQLLTTLAGGAMHCDADTARRLVDAHGADLRLVVLDHGDVVGVGTRTSRPPAWVADAVLALHDTCSEPGCGVAARVCDLDHAQPVADRGPTDVGNLAPLCATSNHRKERDGWTVTQTRDGIRRWTHRRTGVTTRTLPTTWRPPDRTARTARVARTDQPARSHSTGEPSRDPPDG